MLRCWGQLTGTPRASLVGVAGEPTKWEFGVCAGRHSRTEVGCRIPPPNSENRTELAAAARPSHAQKSAKRRCVVRHSRPPRQSIDLSLQPPGCRDTAQAGRLRARNGAYRERGIVMRHDRAMVIAEGMGRSSSKAISDEALIALIAVRDKNAMRLLFVRHSARVFRFLQRLVDSAATAEDLVSETFIEIWRQAGRFEARSKASTWILGIARYKALSSLRQRHYDQLDDSAFELVADPMDDPEVNAQKSKRAAVLRDCLQRLPPAQREILDLIYYHEQSIADVARIIGVPENTVKTRAFYARKRVADLMAERGIERASL